MVGKSNINQVLSQGITQQIDSLAERILTSQLAIQPRPALQFDEERREWGLADIRNQLTLLANAIQQSNPALFAQYLKWAQDMLEQTGQPPEDIADAFKVFRDVLENAFSKDMTGIIHKFFESNYEVKEEAPVQSTSFISDSAPKAALARKYLEILLNGNKEDAIELILDAAEEEGASVRDIYTYVFTPVLREAGRLWQRDEISVADEHFITQTTQTLLSQLYLYFPEVQKKGHRLVAACVTGELHDVGLKMVSDFFEMAGYDTFYLGANTPRDSIIESIRTQKADLVALSASHPMLVGEVEGIIAAIRSEKNLNHVKILVGGAPFNDEPTLWQSIGADGYAKDAEEAVRMAEKFIAGKA
jgi:methanogenic corrinoid protein MtbC1